MKPNHECNVGNLEYSDSLPGQFRGPSINLLSTAPAEHWYFSAVALTVTVIVLAGFVPLYTLRLLRHDPNLTLLVHAHGFVMIVWIALFVAHLC